MEQNNKLIVEFMEYPKSSEYWKGKSMVNWGHEDYKDYYYVDGKYNHMDGSNFHLGDMQFDTSWDWLMPVVQKIGDEYLNTPFDETYSKLTEGYENIWTIEDTYKAVVEFIKDQNTIKNN